MPILKRIIFIFTAILFISAAFWIYTSAKEIKIALAKEKEEIILKLKNKKGGWQDSVTKTWNIQGAMPGQTEPLNDFCRWIQLKNAGNIEAEQLKISLKNTSEDLNDEESDTLPKSAEGMDKYIEITQLKYGNWWLLQEDLKKRLKDLNGNGFIDLDDFEAQGFDGLEPPCLGTYPPPKPFSMESLLEWAKNPKKYLCRIKQMSICLRLHPSTPNDYQGDRVITDLTFTLTD